MDQQKQPEADNYDQGLPPPPYNPGQQTPHYMPQGGEQQQQVSYQHQQQVGYQQQQQASCPQQQLLGYPQQQSYVYPQQQSYVYPQQGANMQAPGSYGAVVQPSFMSPPENHTGLAWFSCLLCFWPLGLVAIIKSTEPFVPEPHVIITNHMTVMFVDASFRRGDLTTANSASRRARLFSLISIGIGIGSWLVGLVMIIVFVSTDGSGTAYND